MKHVITVPPAVSWSVLGTGVVIAFFFVWHAYAVISSIDSARASQAQEYGVNL